MSKHAREADAAAGGVRGGDDGEDMLGPWYASKKGGLKDGFAKVVFVIDIHGTYRELMDLSTT